jgi:class 3 adenylate cyclase
MPDLPTGTVTFLFTDIEGSTRLWEQHPEAMPQAALARHDALLSDAVEAHGGHRLKSVGDQFCAVLAAAPDALAAQQALGQGWDTPLARRLCGENGMSAFRSGSQRLRPNGG